jgi:hypothetical protein
MNTWCRPRPVMEAAVVVWVCARIGGDHGPDQVKHFEQGPQGGDLVALGRDPHLPENDPDVNAGRGCCSVLRRRGRRPYSI